MQEHSKVGTYIKITAVIIFVIEIIAVLMWSTDVSEYSEDTGSLIMWTGIILSTMSFITVFGIGECAQRLIEIDERQKNVTNSKNNGILLANGEMDSTVQNQIENIMKLVCVISGNDVVKISEYKTRLLDFANKNNYSVKIELQQNGHIMDQLLERDINKADAVLIVAEDNIAETTRFDNKLLGTIDYNTFENHLSDVISKLHDEVDKIGQ